MRHGAARAIVGEPLQNVLVARVVLIAHGFDMRRAIPEFARVGVEVVPAPTQVSNEQMVSLADFLPSPGALQASYYALYELLANAVRVVDP